MTWSGQHVLKDLRVDVFEHLHELSLSYYAEHEAGDVMSRITNDMDTIQQAISFALVQVLERRAADRLDRRTTCCRRACPTR